MNKSKNKPMLIVANGRLECPEQLRWALSQTDHWIAVDGGMRHFFNVDQKPHRWIGDMDSFIAESIAIDWLEGIAKETFPPEKDLSDTALAIERGIELGATQFLLMGMLGGRLDHTLFNVSLMMALQMRGIDSMILSGDECQMSIGAPGVSQRRFKGLTGTTMSLYPIARMKGIDLEGFKYPLNNASMAIGDTLGLSNEVIQDVIEIRVNEGMGLIAFTNCLGKEPQLLKALTFI